MSDSPRTALLLDDQTIAALDPAERLELIGRLQRDVALQLPGGRGFDAFRRVRLGVMTLGTTVLAPWIVYLALTLPPSYQARHWTLTWVGFDLGLLALMATSAVLGLLHNQLVALTAFATGVLLVCDAWFDIMTSAPQDRIWALLSAGLVELPVAAVLVRGAITMVRLMATRMWLLEPGQSLWRLRLPGSFGLRG